MSRDAEKIAYGASSLAIWANVVISLVYTFAFVYAAQNLGGDASGFYWFLAVIAGISTFMTALTKVIVDVAWMLLRKKENLDKAKQK